MTRVRKVLVAVAAIVGVVIVTGVVALSTIDLNQTVAFVEAKAREATGRELKLKGKIGFKLSLLPTVAADDVSFQNAPWGSRPLLATVKRVEIQIALLPLLTGEVVIRRVLLVEPDLLLEVNAKGAKNWVFASPASGSEKIAEATDGAGFEVHRIEVRNGLLTYRQAKPRLEHKARIEQLELDGARGFDALAFDGKLALNEVPLSLEGHIDNLRQAGKPGATGGIALEADVGGNALRVDGRVPLATGTPVGLDVKFSAELKDVATLRTLLQRPVPALPPATLRGRATWTKAALAIEDVVAEIGKSRASGRLHLELEGERRAFELKLDAALVDLGELAALRKAAGGEPRRSTRGGRVFPNDPFPLAALKALDGEAALRIEKLRLADGSLVEDVRAHTRFKRGKIDSDALTLRLQGRELRLEIDADASSGRTLAVNAALTGSQVPLAALTGLFGVTPAPEGAPTDIAVTFSGRGDSVRALMASASGTVRVVVGPGRIKNRTLDVGADVTELLNALNPARSKDPYSTLKCAVLRFPVRKGIASIANGIAVETTRVRVIGGGTINLRNEALALGFRPEAASGLGVGAGNLASFAKVEGTIANPRIGLDMARTATAAAAAGAAVMTGGLTLLAGGLLIDTVPDNPCQVALTGAPKRKKGVVDKVLDPLKKLFGN